MLGSFCLAAVTSPALAAPKKKKAKADTAAEAEPAAETKSEDKSVDDLMEESNTRKSTPSASMDDEKPDTSMDEGSSGEPDAWERPPADEEKPKEAPAPKAVETYGDGRRIEVGLTPGFGFKAGDADWATLDPYSLGLGIRGGYELDSRIFLGAGFVYHLGNSDDLTRSMPGTQVVEVVSARQNYMLAFLEGGYDIWLGDLIVRPSMWLGLGFAVVDPHFRTGGLRTEIDFLFAPGLNLIYVFDGLYIGGDARYVVVTADGAPGIELFGMIGLRFK